MRTIIRARFEAFGGRGIAMSRQGALRFGRAKRRGSFPDLLSRRYQLDCCTREKCRMLAFQDDMIFRSFRFLAVCQRKSR
jgi:hypothetical protein